MERKNTIKGLINRLENQVVFQGKIIYEKGLLFGLSFDETADQCDENLYMDVMVSDFPHITLVVNPDQHNNWKPSGGTIGYVEDGLGVFDTELIAGWVLSKLGYSIPIQELYVDDTIPSLYGKFSAGEQSDGSYFIPSCNINSGMLIRWK